MITFHILTAFPHILDSYITESILRRAQKNKKIKILTHDIRAYTGDTHRTIDDTPYGGGPGMVLSIEPVHLCVQKLKLFPSKKTSRIILLSPRAKKFTQADALRLAKYKTLTFIAGRYEGVDERVAEHITDEVISIGDYVLSGGELPAMVIIEAIARLVPGVLGKHKSAEKLNHAQYTKPEKYFPKRGKMSWDVPKVLLSGNHAKIEEWRKRH